MSETTVRMRSAESDAVLEFSDVDGDSFWVALTARDHAASRLVYAHTDGRGIARLFAEAAREWRGWDGRKAWESIEGELRLELGHDRRGHVSLGVRIRSDEGGKDPWRVEAELSLEAGQLEGIASEAGGLWKS